VTPSPLHPLAKAYLKRLKRTARRRRLRRARRKELIAEIEGHLREAIPPEASDADARGVIDRLGEPAEIVESAIPPGTETTGRRGFQVWAAIVLVLGGGFILPVLGWLLGIVLLWTSTAWTKREKLIGTLVIPGGLGTVPWLWLILWTSCLHGTAQHCLPGETNVPAVLYSLVGAVLVVAPILTAIFLGLRARRTVG
jgi:hypothetical protein